MDETELLYIASIYLGITIALPIAYLTALSAQFLDDAMDWGGVFYKFRLRKAFKFSDIDGAVELRKAIDEVNIIHYEQQALYMTEAYKRIAAKNSRFNRWICRMCLAVFLSIFPTLIGGGILFVLEFPISVILFYLLSLPLLTYRFS